MCCSLINKNNAIVDKLLWDKTDKTLAVICKLSMCNECIWSAWDGESTHAHVVVSGLYSAV